MDLPEDWDTSGFRLTHSWWFCTQNWPPTGHDFSQDFKRLGLREVRLSDWENELDLDSEGIL